MADINIENVSTDIIVTRQINYIILEKLWTYVNKKASVIELYDILGLKENAYSMIRSGNTIRYVNLENRAKWKMSSDNEESDSKDDSDNRKKSGPKKGHLLKLGLSMEVMTGKEMIEVNGITREDWEEYLKQRYEMEKSPERTKVMREMTKKLHLAFSELEVDKKNRKPIDIAFYYYKRRHVPSDSIEDRELKDLQEVLKKITPEMIQECNSELRKEIFNEVKEKYKWLDIMIKYEKEFKVQ